MQTKNTLLSEKEKIQKIIAKIEKSSDKKLLNMKIPEDIIDIIDDWGELSLDFQEKDCADLIKKYSKPTSLKNINESSKRKLPQLYSPPKRGTMRNIRPDNNNNLEGLIPVGGPGETQTFVKTKTETKKPEQNGFSKTGTKFESINFEEVGFVFSNINLDDKKLD